ncbi:hypothetical protein J6TS7_40460 [Paenibacillus dendritiformis]|nr:hypothetical protein J6TS7_40460 [Paenibacillus dendritiformis]
MDWVRARNIHLFTYAYFLLRRNVEQYRIGKKEAINEKIGVNGRGRIHDDMEGNEEDDEQKSAWMDA